MLDSSTSLAGAVLKSKWHDHMTIDNMGANFSLTAGGVENCCFQALGGQFPSKFDTVIPKIPLYEGIVVWILK